MGDHAFCPHCGYDFANDAPIIAGDVYFKPRKGLFWRDAHIRLTPQQEIVAHTLLKAGGAFVTASVIAERAGYEGDNYVNLVAVRMCQIRRALRRFTAIECIQSERGRGRGYRWNVDALPMLEAA